MNQVSQLVAPVDLSLRARLRRRRFTDDDAHGASVANAIERKIFSLHLQVRAVRALQTRDGDVQGAVVSIDEKFVPETAANSVERIQRRDETRGQVIQILVLQRVTLLRGQPIERRNTRQALFNVDLPWLVHGRQRSVAVKRILVLYRRRRLRRVVRVRRVERGESHIG